MDAGVLLLKVMKQKCVIGGGVSCFCSTEKEERKERRKDGGRGKMVMRANPGLLRAKLSLPRPSDDVS
jgi:hypothetical protein